MDSPAFISKFLDNSSFTSINHSVLIGLGGDIYQAFMLHRLIGMYSYFRNQGMLDSDGFFFQTIEDIEKNCGISEYHQRTAIKQLENSHLIETKHIGSPPKRNFRLQFDNIYKLIDRPLPPIPKENNEIFYKDLNRALKISWLDTKKAGGNIDKRLLWFMYVWSDHNFEWTPKDYGVLRHYWRNRYQKKEFDYSDIQAGKAPKGDINKFIDFDRSRIEGGPSSRLIASDTVYYNCTTLKNERFKE